MPNEKKCRSVISENNLCEVSIKIPGYFVR